jgi:hypothetical protein
LADFISFINEINNDYTVSSSFHQMTEKRQISSKYRHTFILAETKFLQIIQMGREKTEIEKTYK